MSHRPRLARSSSSLTGECWGGRRELSLGCCGSLKVISHAAARSCDLGCQVFRPPTMTGIPTQTKSELHWWHGSKDLMKLQRKNKRAIIDFQKLRLGSSRTNLADESITIKSGLLTIKLPIDKISRRPFIGPSQPPQTRDSDDCCFQITAGPYTSAYVSWSA